MNSGSDPSVVNESSILDFESFCWTICHQKCNICRRVGLFLDLNKANICKFCIQKKANSIPDLYNLPVWYDSDGVIQYHLPDELRDLCIGEQMIIQRLSLYIPIQYLRFGQLCCSGHVCAFPQDIHLLCDVLPRLPEQVTHIHVVKQFSLNSGNAAATKTFLIRKDKVLAALRWLKMYNSA